MTAHKCLAGRQPETGERWKTCPRCYGQMWVGELRYDGISSHIVWVLCPDCHGLGRVRDAAAEAYAAATQEAVEQFEDGVKSVMPEVVGALKEVIKNSTGETDNN